MQLHKSSPVILAIDVDLGNEGGILYSPEIVEQLVDSSHKASIRAICLEV